jgi:hypothetical protein
LSARLQPFAGFPSCRFGRATWSRRMYEEQVKVASRSQIAREPLEAVRSIMLSSYEVLIAPGLMSAYFDWQGARGVQAQRPRSLPSTHSRAASNSIRGVKRYASSSSTRWLAATAPDSDTPAWLIMPMLSYTQTSTEGLAGSIMLATGGLADVWRKARRSVAQT